MTKWEVVDSYGVVVHTAPTLQAAGAWIDPVLGIDWDHSEWGVNAEGEGVDDNRFTRNDDGSYTVDMYSFAGGSGGELTVRPAALEAPQVTPDYVLATRGSKIHRRDPDARFVTLCHKVIHGLADPEQVGRAPYLLCQLCAKRVQA